MRYIIIEDRIYKISDQQFNEIEEENKKRDENALIELFEKREEEYTHVGYVEFSFRA